MLESALTCVLPALAERLLAEVESLVRCGDATNREVSCVLVYATVLVSRGELVLTLPFIGPHNQRDAVIRRLLHNAGALVPVGSNTRRCYET